MSNHITHVSQRWSNSEQDSVELSAPDLNWPGRFLSEAIALQSTLGSAFPHVIHHVGSTAVPGLAAKPIIDIILEVPNPHDWPSLIEPLQQLGYGYWADNPDTDTMFFVKGMPPFGVGRTHHIHVLTPNATQPKLRFRDYLIAHDDEARRYEALKRDLVVKYRYDRDGYTNAKSEYIQQVLRTAEKECSNPLSILRTDNTYQHGCMHEIAIFGVR